MIAMTVAPLAGAWIEIAGIPHPADYRFVAPLAGAWIEIDTMQRRFVSNRSLPLRELGLK